MSDQTAIDTLQSLYTDGCNRQDWPQVMATFAEDGVWAAAGAEHRGHTAIQGAMTAFLGMMDYFVQTSAAPIVTIDGDKATARVTIRECGKFKGRDEALEVLGYYTDDIVRTAEGWKFARRTFTGYGMHRFALLQGPAF